MYEARCALSAILYNLIISSKSTTWRIENTGCTFTCSLACTWHLDCRTPSIELQQHPKPVVRTYTARKHVGVLQTGLGAENPSQEIRVQQHVAGWTMIKTEVAGVVYHDHHDSI